MIRKWYDIFKDNHDLVEIRIIDNNSKKTYSGYFTDIESILLSIRKYDDCNIYFTLNSIDDACYSREQRDRIITKPKCTTSDKEILGRDWCLIDIDCEKPADTNSTNQEKELAKEVVNNVYKFLRDEGFNSPIVCDSANGFHLLIKQQMINTDENTQVMKDFLQVLDMFFSTDKVKIDTSTFNASRICKLYGCVSRKGSNTPERPQRESAILRIPPVITPTENEYFKKVAAMLPKVEAPNRSNNYNKDSFNLQEFIEKYGIKIRNKVHTPAFTKYVLEECPFNSSHRAPDSAIFEMANGSYGFKCLHASCSGYTWKDFRLHFDPDAYTKTDFAEFQYKDRFRTFRPLGKEDFTPVAESSEKGKKWLSMSDIKFVDLNSIVTIPTGYDLLDKKIMGLMLGDITVLSGLSGAGKTSFIDCLTLNVINCGYKAAIWSGELQDFRFQGWIDQIAAGKNFVCKKEGYDNFYYAPRNICDKINRWLDGKLYLYNNNYNNRWIQLFSDIKVLVEEQNIQLVVLDNLMSLQIDDYEGDKYSKQTAFINELKEYAKKKNIHVILVAHPRKEGGFLRKESISGTADLTNLADNVIILHRVNKDFETRAGEFWGKDKVFDYLKYSTVIELCKNRSLGVVDLIVGMYYEPESRRLKNTISEHMIYGWQEEAKPMEAVIEEDDSYNGYQRDYIDSSMPFGNPTDEVPF